MLFSLLIACLYASCGYQVSVNSFSAFFWLFLLTVNNSLTHSLPRSPQSARDANFKKSPWKCLIGSFLLFFHEIKCLEGNFSCCDESIFLSFHVSFYVFDCRSGPGFSASVEVGILHPSSTTCNFCFVPNARLSQNKVLLISLQ